MMGERTISRDEWVASHAPEHELVSSAVVTDDSGVVRERYGRCSCGYVMTTVAVATGIVFRAHLAAVEWGEGVASVRGGA